jgi:Spy/CpxP family protein refolding chaperone
MHPGFIPHWQRIRFGDRSIAFGWGACGSSSEASEGSGGFRFSEEEEGGGFPGGFGVFFGVRRPLRFLAYKLGLDEAQTSALARVLDEIKTERAQAAVDHRRTISAFADAVEGEAFDEKRAEAGAAIRLESAHRLRDAVLAALRRLHATLSPEQRAKLAFLIRTGAITL